MSKSKKLNKEPKKRVKRVVEKQPESISPETVLEVLLKLPEPQPVESVNYQLVEKGGRQYRKFKRDDGTTYLELVE